MKKHLARLAAVVFFCAGACAGVAHAQNAEEKVELKLRWQAEKDYLVRIENDTKTTQIINGQTNHVAQNMVLHYLYQVISVDEQGVADIDLIFQDVAFTVSGHSGKNRFKVEYDSTKKPKEIPPVASGFAALVGQMVEVKLDSRGRVVEARGFKELLQHLTKNITLPAGPERAAIEQSLHNQFGEEAFSEMMQKNMGGFYPGRAVAVGETWSDKTELTQGFPMIMDSSHTLQERNKGISLIATEASTIMDAKNKPIRSENTKITYEFKGKHVGTMLVRESDGFVTRAQNSFRLAGQMFVNTTPANPGDIRPATKQSWPIYIVGTTMVELENPQ